MTHRIIHRSLSIALSAVFTLIIMGGIDQLSQPAETAPQWAQISTPRA